MWLLWWWWLFHGRVVVIPCTRYQKMLTVVWYRSTSRSICDRSRQDKKRETPSFDYCCAGWLYGIGFSYTTQFTPSQQTAASAVFHTHKAPNQQRNRLLFFYITYSFFLRIVPVCVWYDMVWYDSVWYEYHWLFVMI